MDETPAGWLAAQVDRTACDGCRVCIEVCPGRHLRPGVLNRQSDPFEGPVEAAYVGRTSDRKLLQHSQSGGVVTAVLEHLFDSGQITQAVVADMPEDGSLRPRPLLTADRGAVRQAGGSKYCPIAVAAVLPPRPVGAVGPTALVGLPCHVHAWRNAQQMLKGWRGWDPLMIGLVCQGVLSFLAMDHLIGQGTVARDAVAGYRFRSKRFHGWPGDGCIIARDGNRQCVSRLRRLRCKSVFTPAYCYLCFDKMNLLCDIVVGDAWGLCDDKRGTSAVLARTPRGLEALEAAAGRGALNLDPVSPEAIFRGQGLPAYRRDWAAYTAAWTKLGHDPPDFGIEARWHPPAERLALRPYRKQLRWARSFAAAETPDEALRAAERRLRLNDVTGTLSRYTSLRRIGRALWRRLRRGTRKVEH